MQERQFFGTQEVLPRTTTTLVVLKASTDHGVAQSQRHRQSSFRPFVVAAKDCHVHRADGVRVDAESARSTFFFE